MGPHQQHDREQKQPNCSTLSQGGFRASHVGVMRVSTQHDSGGALKNTCSNQ